MAPCKAFGRLLSVKLGLNSFLNNIENVNASIGSVHMSPTPNNKALNKTISSCKIIIIKTGIIFLDKTLIEQVNEDQILPPVEFNRIKAKIK